MIGESAAHVGKELAEQIRLAHAGMPSDLDEILMTIDRLTYSKATTTRDVLALIVTCRHIINSIPVQPGTLEAEMLGYAQTLQTKAIGALEPIAKERAAVFQGYEVN